MTNRQPAVETVAAMLTTAFAEVNVKLGHQKSLNLAAQSQGFKNYAHYTADADRKANLASVSATQLDAPAPEQSLTATSAEEEVKKLRTALEWLVLRTESVLASRPVRDLDECLVHAKLLVAAGSTSE